MVNPDDNRLKPLERTLVGLWPRSKWVNERVLVAVSGGPDSMALLRCLVSLQPDQSRLVVAHFNHKLRDSDSDADQSFVAQVTETLGLETVTGQPPAAQPSANSEADARDMRYQFLIRAAEQSGARYLATGHTSDDQTETVLHHVLRGTGLAGLAGIPRIRVASEAVTIVRPLLSAARHEILEYLRHLDQEFRSDATNDESHFTRNRIRHELLPQLRRDYNPEVDQAILRLARIASDAQESIQRTACALLERSIQSRSPDSARIDPTPLSSATLHLRREAFVLLWQQQAWPLQAMRFEHWQQMACLAGASEVTGSAALSLPGQILARLVHGELLIQRIDQAANA